MNDVSSNEEETVNIQSKIYVLKFLILLNTETIGSTSI